MAKKNPAFFGLLIALAAGTTLHAQVITKADSLNSAIATAAPAEAVALFSALSKLQEKMPKADALRSANRSLEVAIANKNQLAQVLAYVNLANIYFKFGNNDEALKQFQRGHSLAQQANDPLGLAVLRFHFGHFLGEQGLLSEGLQHILDAAKIFEALGRHRDVILCHYESCVINFNARNFQQCIEEGYQVLQLHDKYHMDGPDPEIDFQRMSTHNTIGLANQELRQYDIAIVHYDKAEAIAQRLKNEFWIGLINGNKGVVLKEIGRLDEAMASILADYETSKKFSIWTSAAMACISISEMYLARKDMRRAEQYLDSARIMFGREPSATNPRKGMAAYWLGWAKYKGAIGDTREAYEALLRHVALRDSLFQEQEALNLAKVKATFDLDRKQTEIENLTRNNEVQQERIRAQQTLFVATLIGLILLVVLVISLVYNFRRQHNISRIVRQQRDEIELKNHELETQSTMLQENNQYIQAMNEQLEQKVAMRTRELETANKELDTFLYRSSHDIRRPITTLLGLDQVARHVIKDPQAVLLFDKVVETARHMDNMLFKMQMVYELNRSDTILEPVPLNEVLCQAVDHFNPEYERYHIQTHLHLPESVTILSNRTLLNIIFRNTVENAILFRKTQAGASPFINLSLQRKDQNVEVTIADNGIGVEERYQAQLYDLYFRASQASKGNGLGLYLVKKAVQKLNGSIHFISDYGVGTTITMTLPIVQ